MLMERSTNQTTDYLSGIGVGGSGDAIQPLLRTNHVKTFDTVFD